MVSDVFPADAELPPSDQPALSPELASLDDVLSELDRSREELDEVRDQLIKSQRLAAIGTVAAGVAHEFNNLLTPIIAHAQLALGDLAAERPQSDQIEKALRRAHDNATKAGRICGAMLNLARNTGPGGLIDVRQLVDEALAIFGRDLAREGVTLAVDVPDDLRIRGDAVQLEQVLLNLLINARHALIDARGGRLGVAAGESDGSVTLRIADTGGGIDPKHLPRVFEPFFTTKATAAQGESRGTGLGLSICREIIERHGGQIRVDSTLRVGTTFTINLPAA